MELENLQANQFPGELDIQAIANQLFKAAPNQSGNTESFTNERDYHANVDKVKTNLTEGNLLASPTLPPSVAGSGISPSLTEHQNSFSIDDPQTSLPDPHFYNGQIPESVAGSGKQPTLDSQNSNFSLEDPQTSLPDPHFYNGQIPVSVAGSGKQPSYDTQQPFGNLSKQQPFNSIGTPSHE